MVLHHGCSHIRISTAHSLFAAPRSFSQLITSFIGSQCQGILHMLFFAWTTFCISGDILSVLVFLAWIAVFHTCSLRLFIVFGKIVSFYPLRKNLISINWLISSFPLLLSVMYVTFILLRINMSFLLFGFQWAFFLSLTLVKLLSHLIFYQLP